MLPPFVVALRIASAERGGGPGACPPPALLNRRRLEDLRSGLLGKMSVLEPLVRWGN